MKTLSWSLAFLVATSMLSGAQTRPATPVKAELQANFAIPVEPIPATVEAFQSHPVVALGNVEFRGNDVVDRFIRGEDVPYDSMRCVWQNTTQVEYEWALPIYEDFFRTVRAVNASLPRTDQLRVLLGDPAIDWEQVHTLQDVQQAMGDRFDAIVYLGPPSSMTASKLAADVYLNLGIVRRLLVLTVWLARPSLFMESAL